MQFLRINPGEVPGVGPSTNSSAERTTATKMNLAHADAGVTSSGDAMYAEVAFLKGSDPSGLEAELIGVSGQGGAQTEVSATVAKVSIVSDDGDRMTVETVGGRSGVGVYNTDGSTGLNVGGSGNLIAAEGHVNFDDGSSLTAGLSAGFTRELSYGRRDADRDGSIEHCAKLGAGRFTVGACVEEHTAKEGKDAVVAAVSSVTQAIDGWWQRL